MIWPEAYHSLPIIDRWIGKCIKWLSEIKMLPCFFFFLFWGGMLNEIRLQQSTLLDCICSLSSLKLWFAWGEGTLHEIRTWSQLPSVMNIGLWIVTIFITEKNSYTCSWELMKFILLCSQKGGKHCQGILSAHSPEEPLPKALLSFDPEMRCGKQGVQRRHSVPPQGSNGPQQEREWMSGWEEPPS